MFSLQAMRDQKNLRWPLYILFGLIIISFIFFYGWQTGDNRGAVEVEFARIEGKTITTSDMIPASMSVEQEKAAFFPPQIMQQIGTAAFRNLATPADVAREAANMMLVERVADEKGIEVTREQIVESLRSQPGMSQQMLEMVARQMRMTPAELVELERRRAEIRWVKSLVGQTAHASLFELWQEYLIDKEKIGLEVAGYPAREFERQVAVTEQDLADHLADNREKFAIKAQRQYDYALISKSDLRQQVMPTSAALHAYFEQNQARYRHEADARGEELVVMLPEDADTSRTQAALDLLGQARPRAMASDAWTTLAQELEAENPNFLIFGREFPWTVQNSPNASADYQNVLRSLARDEVSSPMLESGRAVLLRVRERREAGTPSLDEVRTRVESDYIAAEVDRLFAETAEKWRQARENAQDMQSFTAAVGVNDELTTMVDRTATFIPGIGVLSREADYLRTLAPNELSDVIQAPDRLLVLQVRNEREGYDPTLEEVRDKVEAAVRGARSADLARLAAEQNLQVIRNGADFKTALADAPISPITAEPITRTQPVRALGSPLVNFRQEAASLKVGSTGMSAYGFDPDRPEGYAVWKVVSVQQPTKTEFAQERNQVTQDYMQLQQMAVVQEWLADQRKSAGFELLDAAKPADARQPAAKKGEKKTAAAE